MTSPSILVVGATGRLGLEVLRHLASHPAKPQVHAFCRTPSKLNKTDAALCASVVAGNARSSSDIEKALRDTDADVVIVSVGAGDNVGKTDIRTASAHALAEAMHAPGLQSVCAVVVSSVGAGDSKIKVGLGMGKLISFHLRHVIKDHNGQEAAFLGEGDGTPSLRERTLVVRPTSLTDGKSCGKVVTFGDNVKPPAIKVDRADVAMWISNEVCGKNENVAFGKVVNITVEK